MQISLTFLSIISAFCSLMWCFPQNANAQEPNIAYPSSPYERKFTLNATITPFKPENSGGAVPPTEYGAVSTYAGQGAEGHRDGNAADALFFRPCGITVDASGTMYIADTFNQRIRKISRDGTVTTIAGGRNRGRVNANGIAASFYQPYGLTTDNAGNVYVADSENNQIRKISPAGDVTLFAGRPNGGFGVADGPATAAAFELPTTLVFNSAGDLFIADANNNTIRKLSAAGTVTTYAGFPDVTGYVDARETDARFWQPVALVIGLDGNLYVTDYFNHVVRMIDPSRSVTTYAGNHLEGKDNGPKAAASFKLPTGLAIDPVGNLYVSDDNDLIRRISKKTGLVTTIAGSGAKGSADGLRWEASFDHPIGMVFDQEGNLFVADEHNNKIRKITLGGGFSIDKPLPAGLHFNARTGEISGTPTVDLPPTEYTVTGYNEYGESSTVVILSVVDPNISFPPIPDKTLCDPDFLPGASTPNTVSLTYTSSNPAVAVITPDQKIHITGLGTTDITVSDGAAQKSVPLRVVELPKPLVSISPDQLTACEDRELIFTATATNTGNNPDYQWKVNDVPAGENSQQFSSSTLQTGDVISCTVVNTDGFCIPVASLSSNTATVTINPNSTVSVVVRSSQNQPVCPGSPITFTATPSTGSASGFKFDWTINGISTGNSGTQFTSAGLQNNDVVSCVLLPDDECSTVVINGINDRVTVQILPVSVCRVDVPNVFSPNHDGSNDTWIIPALVSYPSCVVMVHDRQGQLIFSSSGYKTPWDGTYKGKALPVGTYYYLITLTPEFQKISGAVTIIR